MRAVGKKPDSTVKARGLRKAATEAEAILWAHVRNRHLERHKFNRQYPIGSYFADFVCRDATLVVEVDGGQHSDSPRDLRRDQFLNRAGYGVLRFWNNEITENLAGVLEALRLVLDGRPSPGLRYAPATLSRDAGEGKNGAVNFVRAPSPLPLAGEGGAQRRVRAVNDEDS